MIDLSKQEGKARDEKEKIDEDKRLLYVALTRARFKLYIPYYPAKGFHPWAGPVSRFMASAMAGAFPEDAENPAAARPPLEPRPPLEAPPPGRPMEGAAPQLAPTPLFPLAKTHAHKKILLESFSSLQAGRRAEEPPDAGAPDFSTGVRTGREDDEGLLTPPAEEIPTQNPADEIPGGADPGSMFHDILERIDFIIAAHHPEELLKDTEAGAVVVQCMEQYQVDAQWRPQVCRVVQNTLTAPIRELGEGVVLADLKKKDRLHEVEFFYPFPLPLGAKSPTPDGAASRDGFIRGYVDLIFRHDGKYYIADWKSNKLPEGYAPDVLLDHMTRAGYDLQYKVYTVAALRWLARTLGRRFDPQKHFGGVFYFYLRGMGAGPDHGVCHVSPGAIGALENVEREIKEMIRVHPTPRSPDPLSV